MDDLQQRLARLSAEQRKQLDTLLNTATPDRPIPRRADSRPARLSFAQERLWFLSQLETDRSDYNVPVAFEIEGHLDASALEKALNAVVERHQILRTTYVSRDGIPYQQVAPAQALHLERRDFSAVGDEGFWRWMVDESARPFHLATDPVIRAYLLHRGASRQVLLLNLHHIAFDGWSMGVLKRELSQYYRAFAAATDPDLPPLPVQYADFAEWQRNELDDATLQAQHDYWTKRLAGAEFLRLRRERNAVSAAAYGRHEPFDFSPELRADLRAMCRREGVTLFILLLAGFQALLSRYTGQVDISVGAPVANRDRVETEDLIGFFVNTLVFRTNLSGNPPFREILARVRDLSLDALSNADLPFERLVEALQPERRVGLSPLFQAMLAVQPVGGRLEIPGARVKKLHSPQQTSKFDLLLAIDEDDDRLHGTLFYHPEVFYPAAARRFVGCFRRLLEAVVAQPERELSRLPILNAAERRTVLVDWNPRSEPLPEAPCLVREFERVAASDPNRVAIAARGASVTYGDLDRWSNAIADQIHCRGLGRESGEKILGVLLERSPEAIAALLGVLKAGCAYLPLDPAHPDKRLSFLLTDSAAAAVLTTPELRARLGGIAIETIEVPTGASSSRNRAIESLRPNQVAYLLYTSGSTGKPKGVLVTHRGLFNALQGIGQKLAFTRHDVMPWWTTITFDIAAVEVFLPLISGGRVHIVPPDAARDAHELARLLHEGSITAASATPATWQMLIDAGWRGSSSFKILSGGEAMSRKLADALLDRAQAVWNCYGPTETAIYSTACRIQRESGPPPIGKPLPNTRVYVLDRHLQPVPIGTPGELHIGGHGVARGYLNRPELTAERFIDDPFAETGERLYRTGDLVRWREDGQLEFRGRTDDQIKIRGFRVEPAEVEAALLALAGVRQAAAVVRERADDDRILIAYVSLDAGCTATPHDLKVELARVLPDYLTPSAIRVLESLPLGTTGKVDRKALAALPYEAPSSAGKAPQSPLEILIAQIWSELLCVPVTATDANFFTLGGHSLLAARVVSRLRRVLGIAVPVKVMFESPTVAEQALSVAQLQAEIIEEADLAKLLDEIESGIGGGAAGG
jgi:amino acid adenylation domain-containing protein